jgi:hypothetical protein
MSASSRTSTATVNNLRSHSLITHRSISNWPLAWRREQKTIQEAGRRGPPKESQVPARDLEPQLHSIEVSSGDKYEEA